MASVVLEVVYAPAEKPAPAARESLMLVGGPAILLGAVLVLGLYVPPPLHRLLAAAAQGLGMPVP